MRVLNFILFAIGGYLSAQYLANSIRISPQEAAMVRAALVPQIQVERNPQVRAQLMEVYSRLTDLVGDQPAQVGYYL